MNDSTLDELSAAHAPSGPLRHAQLTIVAHPDLRRVGAGLSLPPGQLLEVSRLSPIFDDGLPLADRTVSRVPVTFGGTRSGVVVEGEGWRLSDGRSATMTWRGHSVGGPEGPGEWQDRGLVLWASSRVALLLELGEAPGPDWFGRSFVARRVAARCEVLARPSAPVLVRGPSGAGKELLARGLHERGPRAGGPFVSVNLASVPATTAASSLFGHVRGAFTGADTASSGLFGSADGGTLFLDEIGAAPPDVQDLLLRAVELGEVLPVGARGPRRVDVRVVAATDADLEAAMAEGRFRRPLYYRLAGHVLDVPPLAARRADIPRLFVEALVAAQAELGAAPAQVTAETLVGLLDRSFLGNVRELRALASRVALGAPLPPEERAAEPIADAPRTSVARLPLDPARVRAALDESGGVLAQAARALGVSNAALHQFLARSGTARRARDLDDDELAAALEQAGDVTEAARALGVTVRGLQLRLARDRRSP